MPKKSTKAKVKRDLKAIDTKLSNMLIEKFKFGTDSPIPISVSKLIETSDFIRRAIKRVK